MAAHRARCLAESDAFVHAPVAYSVLDLEGRQLAANPAFQDLFGNDQGLVRVEEITHPDEIERTSAYLHALAVGERERVVVDKRYLRADGTVFWGRLTATAVADGEGRNELLLGIIEDVTPQMETLAQLAAASETKSEFVARVSHDLRTPLHAIGGLAELLSVAGLDPQNQGFAEAIGREAEALRALVDDLLDLSRVEAGSIDINRTAFSLAACVRASVEPLRRRAGQRSLELDVSIDDAVDRDVWGDPYRLRQVLVNLVDNAVKFTSRGSVRVEARPGDADEVVINVHDSGPGIDPTDIDRIFDPFAQAHDDQGGTGLGLTICRELMTAMDGALTVTSTPGRGSTFTVSLRLPAATVGDTVPTGVAEPATVETAVPAVLVVEDSPVNRLLVASQLEHLGYRYALAADGAQALEALAADEHSLVLMDWHLPDMDGLETTRRLRRFEAETGRDRVPVVAVTARAMSGDRQRCLDAGMDDFLAKPVGLEDLRRVLRQWQPADSAGSVDPERSSTTSAPFDVDAIEALVDDLGDRSIVAILVRTFLDELPARMDAIVSGAAAGDIERVRRAAHTLKSTTAMLGATDLHQVAARIELRCREGSGDLDQLVDRAERRAAELTAELTAVIERLESP
ncbi:MAG: ATP-binding protein [Acidimicrobiia bacterium]|nr:ATP-binding protein [Acidimicrobiia bacterium]